MSHFVTSRRNRQKLYNRNFVIWLQLTHGEKYIVSGVNSKKAAEVFLDLRLGKCYDVYVVRRGAGVLGWEFRMQNWEFNIQHSTFKILNS
ncbi:MAG: hypothetical protein CEE38_13640 [Planctomycetes bacterium B3_Pla]|nr:MAG: hypothetical protein CEE38_13640 [Planctomycetes bacterium B3_Pla]